jgi:uncharacterized protein YraI
MMPARIRSAFLIGVATMFLATQACAQSLTLTAPLPLRAGPGPRYRVATTAPVGAHLAPEPGGAEWTRVDYNGHSYYAETQQLLIASGAETTGAILPADPTCDFSYPYSGSNIFVDRPLAKLRHSEPLGFLFGYHRRNPC